MKVCFPVKSDNGMNSEVFGHFGSAPIFVTVDTELKVVEIINNKDLGHDHGKCSPMKALNGKAVDAIVVGGIGTGAINKLNGMGISVYKALKGTVMENLVKFEDKLLSVMSAEDTCGGHSHSGNCAH